MSVVVRSGVAYLLKVELPAILPPHSRDVLETIRRVNILYMYRYMLLGNRHVLEWFVSK